MVNLFVTRYVIVSFACGIGYALMAKCNSQLALELGSASRASVVCAIVVAHRLLKPCLSSRSLFLMRSLNFGFSHLFPTYHYQGYLPDSADVVDLLRQRHTS